MLEEDVESEEYLLGILTGKKTTLAILAFSELTYRELQKACTKRYLSARGSTAENLKQRFKEIAGLAKSSKDQNMESFLRRML